MSNDLNAGQSGKSGDDAFGWSASASTDSGGAGTGTAASSFGGTFGDAGGFGSGGDAGSVASAGGAFGGDVSDNTAIGSINISF